MSLTNEVVFISGANRGIGLEFAKSALARGAKKVYAAARNPESIPLEGVVKIKLDVTNTDDIATLRTLCSDVTLVINNAGIARFGSFLDEGSEENSRAHFDTNFFGPLRVVKAFAPVLANNGGGAILNVLSALSWFNSPFLATYGASKSATWALTNSLRQELAGQGTLVSALHMGLVDTELTTDIDAPKERPEDIVARAFDGLAARQTEILADEQTVQIKQTLSNPDALYLKTQR